MTPLRTKGNNARVSLALTSAFAALLLASGTALAGTYLNQCRSPHKDPATGRTICPKPATNPKPTKCCKIDGQGNIDLSDCGGVVSTETGYWCIKGDDYVGVYCKPSADGKTEICENPQPPHANQYVAECDHWLPIPGSGRICADGEPGLPSGLYCCEKIEGGKVDEGSCSSASVQPDARSGTTTVTCTAGILLACAPESGLLTWCSPI